MVECFHPDRDPIWWGLVANRPELRDGVIELGEQPGLGWELDWDYAERYRVTFDRDFADWATRVVGEAFRF